MTGDGDDSSARVRNGPWVVVGLVLAVAATALLLLTNEVRWLRLGIVAALWAALIAGFLATRNRKQARASEQAAADAQTIYELELEREVTARREHELEVEADAQQRADARAQEELESLRSEVTALRETLQRLFGGEVLYERVALTAQSTRMRQFGEQQAVAAGGAQPVEGAVARQLDPLSESGSAAAAERTEVFDAVAPNGRRPAEQVRSPAAKAPTQAPQQAPPQTPQQAPPPARPSQQAPRQAKPAARQAGGQAPQQAPKQPQAAAQQPKQAPNEAQPEHPTRRVAPAAGAGAAASRAAKAASVARGTQVTAPAQPNENGNHDKSDSAVQTKAATTPVRRPAAAEPAKPTPAQQVDSDSDEQTNTTVPDSAHDAQRDQRQGGRRRKPDSVPEKPQEPEPAEAPEEASGSHAQGRSVSDLLAAHGTGYNAPHRRRRAQD